jgi:hypothetical protein
MPPICVGVGVVGSRENERPRIVRKPSLPLGGDFRMQGMRRAHRVIVFADEKFRLRRRGIGIGKTFQRWRRRCIGETRSDFIERSLEFGYLSRRANRSDVVQQKQGGIKSDQNYRERAANPQEYPHLLEPKFTPRGNLHCNLTAINQPATSQ